MKIAIGSDHHGVELKKQIITFFKNHIFFDVGTNNNDRVDYPDFAHEVCQKIITHQAEIGILLCGTGIGMSIVANRYSEIFAGLCWNTEVAKQAKAHDHINILVLPADFINKQEALSIVTTWLETEELTGVYEERLKKI